MRLPRRACFRSNPCCSPDVQLRSLQAPPPRMAAPDVPWRCGVRCLSFRSGAVWSFVHSAFGATTLYLSCDVCCESVHRARDRGWMRRYLVLSVCPCLRLLLSCFSLRVRCLFYCRLALCLSFLVGQKGFASAVLLPIRVWLPISDRFRLPLPTKLCLLLVYFASLLT